MSTGALTLTPLSAVACGSVLCRQAGALWATVVVKATFQLVHGETARPVAPLPLVQGDRMGAGGSLAAARETAPHIPNAGVVVTGHAHAPGGRAVPSMSVRLGVSRERPVIDKTLHVFGSRAAGNPSAVMPFQKMPIVYEKAFGGPGVWENPVGTGGPGSRALPNVVDPKDGQRTAGFGPVAGAWMPRRRLLGGADPAALEEAIFDPPRGFDWRYFQAAPADQQLDAFRGDEWIVLDGMHPTLARVQTRLPQVRAQARRSGPAAAAAEPIELRADMLVIDADGLTASLVWRGRFPAGSVEALRSVRVLVGLEVAGRAIEWGAGATARAVSVPVAAETQAVNLSAIFGGSLPFDSNRESALPPPSATQTPASFSTGTAAVDVSKILQGAVPFEEKSRPAAPVKAEGPLSATETVAIPALSLAKAQPVPFVAADPNRPPVEAAASRGALKAAPMHTGTTDVNLAEVMKSVVPYRGEAKVAAPAPAVAPAPPPAVAPAPTFAAPAPAPTAQPPLRISTPPVAVSALAPVGSAAPAPPVAAPLSPAALSPALAAPVPSAMSLAAPAAAAALAASPVPTDAGNEVRAAVLERLSTGQSLEGLRLVAADLHDIDFKGASLVGLDLHKAKLVRAKLADTRLSEARLVGADLTGANLSGADLARADLSRAILDGAKLDRAILIGAKLCDARGKGASFTGARMAQADLQGAELHETAMLDIEAPESVWDKASLDGSRFLGAKLRGASFQRATLNQVCFSQADLTSASFQRAVGRAVDLRAARLEAADLRQAQLPEAKLDDAELRDVTATKADLSGARLFRADLSSANLRAARLTNADLLHAKLDGADLRDADLAGIKIDPAAARAAKIRLPR